MSVDGQSHRVSYNSTMGQYEAFSINLLPGSHSYNSNYGGNTYNFIVDNYGTFVFSDAPAAVTHIDATIPSRLIVSGLNVRLDATALEQPGVWIDGRRPQRPPGADHCLAAGIALFLQP